MDHNPGASSSSHPVVLDRKVSNFSEYDEHGTRLIRDRSLPCRMRRIWVLLALLQFATGFALFVVDVYGHHPISHQNPRLSSENARLIYFRFDLYLGVVCSVAQLVTTIVGLFTIGIPCRVYPPAGYRSAHFLLSVFGACLMIISAVSYGITLSNISNDSKPYQPAPSPEELQEQRDVIFTWRTLLSLLVILTLGAVVNLFVVIAVCTASRKCYRNCKICCAEN